MQNDGAVREKHSRLALKLLEDASQEIADGDTVQGADTFQSPWGGATLQITIC